MKTTILTLGTRGDVQPCIAVGLGIQAAGHDVKIAAPKLFEDIVRRSGLDFFPIRDGFRQILETETGSNRLKGELNPLRILCRRKHLVEPVVNRIFSDLWSACTGAEAIIYTALALPVHYIAQDIGVPAFAACFQPLSRTNTSPSVLLSPRFSNMGILNLASHLLVEQALWLLFRSSIVNWRKKSGLSSIPFWGHFKNFYNQNSPVLNGYSSLVVPKPSDWGDRMYLTGYWFLDDPSSDWQPCPDLVDFLKKGEPPVCIGFGSMNDNRVENSVKIAIEAIRKAGKRGIFLVGHSDLNRSDLSCSDDIFFSKDVPHSWLFPQVSAVIHHGGAGTTAAALRAGVPSIIVPFFFDQLFWGRRLAELEVGPWPVTRHRLSVKNIVSAIRDTVDSKKFRVHLQTLSANIRAEDGVKNAVNAFHHEMSRIQN